MLLICNWSFPNDFYYLVRTREFVHVTMWEQIWLEYLYISGGDRIEHNFPKCLEKRTLSGYIQLVENFSKVLVEFKWELVIFDKCQLSNVTFLTESCIQRPLKFSDGLEMGKKFELIMNAEKSWNTEQRLQHHWVRICHSCHSTSFS